MRAVVAFGWLVAVCSVVSTAAAEGLVPRGFKFSYRTLADSTVTTLEFDLQPADVRIGVADSSFEIRDVIRAVWRRGPDDGLQWYFSDSDTLVTQSDMLIHAVQRPGFGAVFFPAGLEAPTETQPQVWSPAQLADGMTWSWTGRGLCGVYDQDRTENYQAMQEAIEIPYRGAWSSYRVQVEETVVCLPRLPDGRAVDAWGRVVTAGRAGKIGEPRWLTAVSTAEGRWAFLLKDAFVELVDVRFDDDPIVSTARESLSTLKRRFRR